jgi:hypothetical protein
LHKLLILVTAIILSLSSLVLGQGGALDVTQALVTKIAPDLAIVTELSVGAPYMGQQFCILYRLRAQRPPAAVDIDPQQYSGFWSEVVAISQDSAAVARPVKGQNAVDYMLRQVIAYPLLEGRQQLPPLSIKVKRAGTRSGATDAWDVVGASSPIVLEVVPLPPGPAATSDLPFVGGIQGALKGAGGGTHELQLEIQGTANLAFFKPLLWLKAPPGVQLRAFLEGTDPLAQTLEIEGRRQLSLLQRQRWRITYSGNGGALRFDGFYLPVFDPFSKTWQSQFISGLTLGEGETGPDPTGGNIDARAATRTVGFFQSRLILWLGGGAAGLVLVAAWFVWRRGRMREDKPGYAGSIPLLEKKLRTSPRAFIDGAHKVLYRYALDQQRAYTLGGGETELDQCWLAIQKFRFSQEPVPMEACEAILQAIRKIL